MTLKFEEWSRKNHRAHILCYFKLCALFHNYQWIQTRDTVRKRPIWAKIGDILARVTLKFDGWCQKAVGHLFYTTPSFVPHDLEIWWMTLKDNRAPLLYYIKLCASFQSEVNSNWSYSPETLNSGQNWHFFPDDLVIWQMILKNNREFYVASSFVRHFIAITEFKLDFLSSH